jgi:hypothetical protein
MILLLPILQGSVAAIKEIDVNKFHEMIGHFGVDRLKKTANIHGLKLKGEFKVCENCPVARQGRGTLINTRKAEVKYREKEFI